MHVVISTVLAIVAGRERLDWREVSGGLGVLDMGLGMILCAADIFAPAVFKTGLCSRFVTAVLWINCF